MDKVILKDNSDYSPLLDRIKSLRCKKCIYESKPQDEKNKTGLGNVNFWFQIEKGTADPSNGLGGNLFLIFDKAPQEWNEEQLIIDIESWEYTVVKDIIY
jgi:hypothetical protein